MKRILATPIIAITLTVLLGGSVTLGAIYIGGSGRTGEVNLQKGLVGHWQFNGNAKDSTPNANDGTLNGVAGANNLPQLTTDRKGQSNKAYDFDGTDDYVDVLDSNSLRVGAGSFTLSVWIKKSSDAAVINVAGNQNGIGSTIGWKFSLENGVPTIGTQDGTGSSIKAQGSVLDDNAWYHVVAVVDRDANLNRIYINSVQDDTADITGEGSFENNAGLEIGNIGSTADRWFVGSIDDVRIYNRALSVTEVTALYDSYDPGVQVSDTQKGLVGHWKFNGNAKDSTPNANSGTLNGDAAVTANDRKGQANKAATFDGTGDYIDYGDPSDGHLDFGTGDFSISLWANATEGVLIQKKNTTTGSLDAGFSVYMRATNPFIQFIVADGVSTDSRMAGVLNQDVDIADGSWHHVTVTWNSTTDTGSVYIDGVFKDSGTPITSTGNISNDYDLEIGRSRNDGTPSGYVVGSIDDVRIYNRALSAEEIADLYDSYSPVVQVSNLQKGLVSHWAFDSNAKDSTPRGNDGTVTGATLTTDRKGQSNRAYSFNGTTDYIRVDDDSSLGITGAVTVSAWVNGGAQDIKRIMAKWDSGVAQRSWVVGTGEVGASQPTDRLSVALSSDGTFGVGSRKYYYTNITVFDSTWHHVAFTFENNILKIYIDGAEDGNVIKTNDDTVNALHNSTADVTVGAQLSSDAPGNFFNGQIDDVRIYNRALTATEITALYESYQ